jgi:hypothetical protein
MKQSNYKLGLMVMAVAAVSFGSSSALFNSETVEQNAYSETSFITGHIDLVVRDGETGDIKAYRQSDNSILNGGMELLVVEAFGANGTSTGPLSHIGVGTSGTAPDGQDTGVITAVPSCARVATTDIQVTGTTTTGSTVVTSTATVDAGADSNCAVSNIQEAAIYNDISAGEAFARNIFSPVTLAGTDTLDITWTFTFTDT